MAQVAAVAEATPVAQVAEAQLVAAHVVVHAVDAAVADTGAASPKDMGRVMAALKAAHGAALDLGRAGPLVRARLSA